MNHLYRRIFKSQLAGSATIRELLQTMFVGEMLAPGPVVWIVSPWVSNIVLVDNRSGNFDTLNPEWGRREARVADILFALMTRGTQVHLVTRDVDSNRAFLSTMRDLSLHNGLEEQLDVVLRQELHTKGLLLSRCSLMGSMNLTFNGLTFNDESVLFSIDAEDLARTRLEFERYRELA